MKIIYTEFGQIYEKYQFGYCVYSERENNESLSNIYNQGFLPYSADTTKKNIFYMARSSRVPLKDFEISSENKRVLKKFEGKLTKKKVSKESLVEDQGFLEFCKNYFDKKHGVRIFTKERLKHVINYFEETLVWSYSDEKDVVVAYIVENRSENIGHYWFSFYDLDLVEQSIGMWIMLDAILQAKKDGYEYYYLGTVYGKKALYKTNIQQLQYLNGGDWSSDIKLLKEKMKGDE